MGQIQSAISGVVGSAIGASIASELKQEKLDEKAKKEKQIYAEAVEGLPKTKEELAGLKEESAGLRKEIGEIKEIAEASPDEAAKEIKMRQVALRTLRGKIKARKMQIEGFKEIIKNFERKEG